MKRGSRILGIDDSPFEKGSHGRALIVGVLMQGQTVEGVLSSSVEIDGDDSTEMLAEMVLRSRFLPEIKFILLNSIMMGGFNVVDIPELSRRLNKPVIAVVRRKPNMAGVRKALSNVCCSEEKAVKIKRAGKPVKLKGLYAQFAGINKTGAEELLSLWKGVPEPVRLAHIIAGGIVKGESSGKA